MKTRTPHEKAANNLKMAMTAAGLSVEDLAKKVQKTPSAVSNWRTRGVPTHMAPWVAEILGCDERQIAVWPDIMKAPSEAPPPPVEEAPRTKGDLLRLLFDADLSPFEIDALARIAEALCRK